MRLLQALVVLLLILPSLCIAKDRHFIRSVTIIKGSDPVTVPAGKMWKVDGLSPYKSETGIGTADFYITGQIHVGPDKAYTITGKFDVLINQKQSSAIWILSGSTVSVGDSRATVTFEEYE